MEAQVHIPKATRITLKTLFKVPDQVFDEIESVDFAGITAAIVPTVQRIQQDVPMLIARQERMERLLIDMAIKLDALVESIHVEQGGLPTELPSMAVSWEGKEEVERLLTDQQKGLAHE
jgi:hypothetical protein